jgi:hypothetical protein
MTVAAALWLAACQPLPHPFADDVPPPGLLHVQDSISLSIAPVEGKPEKTASALAAAVAKALRKQGIAASSRTAGLSSDELLGTLEAAPRPDGNTAVTARWRLIDADGHFLGESASLIEARARDWQDGIHAAVARLAAASADKLAILFLGRPASEPPQEAKRRPPRIAFAGVKGAPGDGDKSLAAAVAFQLRSQGVTIVAADGKEKPDLVLDAKVTMDKADAGKQHVNIVWKIGRADGSKIGTAAQQNDVPAGSLDGEWGNVAYLVATAAREGIMELVIRGMSQPAKS